MSSSLSKWFKKTVVKRGNKENIRTDKDLQMLYGNKDLSNSENVDNRNIINRKLSLSPFIGRSRYRRSFRAATQNQDHDFESWKYRSPYDVETEPKKYKGTKSCPGASTFNMNRHQFLKKRSNLSAIHENNSYENCDVDKEDNLENDNENKKEPIKNASINEYQNGEKRESLNKNNNPHSSKLERNGGADPLSQHSASEGGSNDSPTATDQTVVESRCSSKMNLTRPNQKQWPSRYLPRDKLFMTMSPGATGAGALHPFSPLCEDSDEDDDDSTDSNSDSVEGVVQLYEQQIMQLTKKCQMAEDGRLKYRTKYNRMKNEFQCLEQKFSSLTTELNSEKLKTNHLVALLWQTQQQQNHNQQILSTPLPSHPNTNLLLPQLFKFYPPVGAGEALILSSCGGSSSLDSSSNTANNNASTTNVNNGNIPSSGIINNNNNFLLETASNSTEVQQNDYRNSFFFEGSVQQKISNTIGTSGQQPIFANNQTPGQQFQQPKFIPALFDGKIVGTFEPNQHQQKFLLRRPMTQLQQQGISPQSLQQQMQLSRQQQQQFLTTKNFDGIANNLNLPNFLAVPDDKNQTFYYSSSNTSEALNHPIAPPPSNDDNTNSKNNYENQKQLQQQEKQLNRNCGIMENSEKQSNKQQQMNELEKSNCYDSEKSKIYANFVCLSGSNLHSEVLRHCSARSLAEMSGCLNVTPIFTELISTAGTDNKENYNAGKRVVLVTDYLDLMGGLQQSSHFSNGNDEFQLKSDASSLSILANQSSKEWKNELTPNLLSNNTKPSKNVVSSTSSLSLATTNSHATTTATETETLVDSKIEQNKAENLNEKLNRYGPDQKQMLCPSLGIGIATSLGNIATEVTTTTMMTTAMMTKTGEQQQPREKYFEKQEEYDKSDMIKATKTLPGNTNLSSSASSAVSSSSAVTTNDDYLLPTGRQRRRRLPPVNRLPQQVLLPSHRRSATKNGRSFLAGDRNSLSSSSFDADESASADPWQTGTPIDLDSIVTNASNHSSPFFYSHCSDRCFSDPELFNFGTSYSVFDVEKTRDLNKTRNGTKCLSNLVRWRRDFGSNLKVCSNTATAIQSSSEDDAAAKILAKQVEKLSHDRIRFRPPRRTLDPNRLFARYGALEKETMSGFKFLEEHSTDVSGLVSETDPSSSVATTPNKSRRSLLSTRSK